jgi:3',5'-nucleoside bisphosphate phosphatase
MLDGLIDLHLHTTCSDGLDTPEVLVARAVEQEYRAISITDHDTVTGVIRATEAAKGTDLEIVPGIELSAMDDGDDIHILGYFMDYSDPEFLERISFFMEKRRERADKIVLALNSLGLEISIDTVLKVAHGAPIGRPHIAEAMLSENLVQFYGEAFIRYIGTDGPAYQPKYNLTPSDAIQLILGTGGIPVMAHPAAVHRDYIIHELVEYGLMGLEVMHPLHSPEKQAYYRRLAGQYGLFVTGGSDWHGEGRRRNFDNVKGVKGIPYETIVEMKASADRLKEQKQSRSGECEQGIV